MVTIDLSFSNVIFLSFLIYKCGRSNCRTGVIEIGSAQNDGQFIVQFTDVISIALVQNTHYLQIALSNYNREAYLEKTHCFCWQRGQQFQLLENGWKLFGARSASKQNGITFARVRIAHLQLRSRRATFGST